jgi:hypothetical protein
MIDPAWPAMTPSRFAIPCLAIALGLLASTPAAAQVPAGPAKEQLAPQVARDGWKDCAYNDRPIGCVDRQLDDGVHILWKDGLRMTYREQPPRRAGEPTYLRDRLGGLWRREVLAQGNIVLTNLRNGNRIFVPLRFPCRPPLKGEVGYCHY